MSEIKYFDKNHSTTRTLTVYKPTLEQKPEYKLELKLFLPSDPERKGEGGLRTKGLFKKSYESKPLISVVTVVYNGEEHLEQTIKSVLDQGYDNVEYIIIDGGSNDGTLEIIKKYESAIDYWVSEPDGGIYDAMNKGASLCSGDYVAFLNADDWYSDSTLQSVIELISSSQIDFVYGDLNFVHSDGSISVWRGNVGHNGTHIPHPSSFIRTTLLYKYGFDQKYKIAADYELSVKLFSKNVKTAYLPKVLANFRDGGSSALSYQTIKEDFLITKEYFGLLQALKTSKSKVLAWIRGKIF